MYFFFFFLPLTSLSFSTTFQPFMKLKTKRWTVLFSDRSNLLTGFMATERSLNLGGRLIQFRVIQIDVQLFGHFLGDLLDVDVRLTAVLLIDHFTRQMAPERGLNLSGGIAQLCQRNRIKKRNQNLNTISPILHFTISSISPVRSHFLWKFPSILYDLPRDWIPLSPVRLSIIDYFNCSAATSVFNTWLNSSPKTIDIILQIVKGGEGWETGPSTIHLSIH